MRLSRGAFTVPHVHTFLWCPHLFSRPASWAWNLCNSLGLHAQKHLAWCSVVTILNFSMICIFKRTTEHVCEWRRYMQGVCYSWPPHSLQPFQCSRNTELQCAHSVQDRDSMRLREKTSKCALLRKWRGRQLQEAMLPDRSRACFDAGRSQCHSKKQGQPENTIISFLNTMG